MSRITSAVSDKRKLEWSPHLETYFKQIGEICLCKSILHKRAQKLFNRRSTLIDIPVITLSTVAGTLSIGSNSLFGEYESIATKCIGLLSLIVSVLSTINSYFTWGKRTETHRLTSLEYIKLYDFIRVELRLQMQDRMEAGSMLKLIRNNIDRLTEMEPLVPSNLIRWFRYKFRDARVTRPAEVEHLQEIYIYKEEDEETGNRQSVSFEKVEMCSLTGDQEASRDEEAIQQEE